MFIYDLKNNYVTSMTISHKVVKNAKCGQSPISFTYEECRNYLEIRISIDNILIIEHLELIYSNENNEIILEFIVHNDTKYLEDIINYILKNKIGTYLHFIIMLNNIFIIHFNNVNTSILLETI